MAMTRIEMLQSLIEQNQRILDMLRDDVPTQDAPAAPAPPKVRKATKDDMAEFIAKNCTVEPHKTVAAADLAAAFRAYCESRAIVVPEGSHFGRLLNEARPNVTRSDCSIDGSHHVIYLNLGLLDKPTSKARTEPQLKLPVELGNGTCTSDVTEHVKEAVSQLGDDALAILQFCDGLMHEELCARMRLPTYHKNLGRSSVSKQLRDLCKLGVIEWVRGRPIRRLDVHGRRRMYKNSARKPLFKPTVEQPLRDMSRIQFWIDLVDSVMRQLPGEPLTVSTIRGLVAHERGGLDGIQAKMLKHALMKLNEAGVVEPMDFKEKNKNGVEVARKGYVYRPREA